MNAQTADDVGIGTKFDILSYGNTRGASGCTAPHCTGWNYDLSDVRSPSDTYGGASMNSNNGNNKWTSFANPCTRWIWENQAFAGGGSNDPALAAIASAAGFANVVECLNDARRFTGYPDASAEEIWSGDTTTGVKKGVWLRPRRKSSKNIHLKVTVYMVDGSAGWQDISQLTQSASDNIHLLHVPRVTRYDQEEVKMQAIPLTENGQTTLQFNPNIASGIDIPIPYQKGSNGVGKNLCTYVHNSGPNVDEVDTTVADHDKECFPSVGPYSNELWGACSSTITGYAILCVPHDATRGKLERITIFDESNINMPEGIQYQPSGNNPSAFDGDQWHALEPATPSVNGATNVWWCDDNTGFLDVNTGSSSSGNGYHPSTSDTSAMCGSNKNLGQSQDTITAGDGSTTVTSPLTNGDGLTGSSENFWIVERTAITALPMESLKFTGKSNFNTISAENVELRLFATLVDEVEASDALMSQISGGSHTIGDPKTKWKATSISSSTQGLFTAHVDSERQKATASQETSAWVSGSHSLIEERNDHSRPQVAAVRTWADISTAYSVTLDPDKDCVSTEESSTFCADQIRYTEQNNFHDQHLGKVSLFACVRKIGEATCHNAGGLFKVKIMVDDGNGNLQAVDLGDASSPVVQDAGSICDISFSVNYPNTQDLNNARGSRCILKPRNDIVGNHTVQVDRPTPPHTEVTPPSGVPELY